MIEEKLIILLQIIIRLVVIKMLVAVGIGVHLATGVVASAEILHFLFGCVSPGVICLFFSGKCNQLHRCVFCKVASLQVVRIQVYRSAVYVSVRTDVGKTGVKRPMIIEQTSSHFHRFLVRVE